MQKWYDEGYFTQDLLMKRTHVESEWTPVRVLEQLATSTPTFLTPLAPSRPPEPPQPEVDYASLNGTRYDADPRPLAVPTLTARLHDGSNPSDSPLSSYSNPRFSNNSPDPTSYGARTTNGYTDVPNNSYSGVNTLEPPREPTLLDRLQSEYCFHRHLLRLLHLHCIHRIRRRKSCEWFDRSVHGSSCRWTKRLPEPS